MPLIPAKEFLERFMKRKPKLAPPENESDRYYDAIGELVEKYPVGRKHVRGCGNPE